MSFRVEPWQTTLDLMVSTFPGEEVLRAEKISTLWNPFVNSFWRARTMKTEI